MVRKIKHTKHSYGYSIHIDHLGLFVTSINKYAYFFVIVDAFTKFVFFKAVTNKKVIIYLRKIIETFGACQEEL